jgi:hypothetical protein
MLFSTPDRGHHRSMSDVTTLPAHGEVFLDARGGDRTLRISWHHDSVPDGVVVLSLWRSGLCVGSFRLRSREVPLLIDALARGLGAGGGFQLPAGPGEAGFNLPAELAAPPPPPQRPRPVPSDAGPGSAWPPIAPAAQGEPRPKPQPRPRQRPRPQPIPGPQPNPGQGPEPGPPPGEAGFNLPAEPAAPPPPRQRPQHLQPAAEPPIYNDVQPKPRRYLGGPPNSSGAESWSA